MDQSNEELTVRFNIYEIQRPELKFIPKNVIGSPILDTSREVIGVIVSFDPETGDCVGRLAAPHLYMYFGGTSRTGTSFSINFDKGR